MCNFAAARQQTDINMKVIKQTRYKMKKTLLVSMGLGVLSAALLSAAPQGNEVMTKENGTYVVNTTTLGKNVIGYVGATPVKIYIKNNKVEKVEFLKNQETPKYFAKVKKAMLTAWDGMKVKDAAKQKVDGVTGATITSDAIVKNVQLGLEYYQSHK